MSTQPEYIAVIEQASDGSFSAYVPDLPGCTACGDTLEEVRREIAAAVKVHIESLRMHHDPVPPPRTRIEKVRAA